MYLGMVSRSSNGLLDEGEVACKKKESLSKLKMIGYLSTIQQGEQLSCCSHFISGELQESHE